MKYQDIKDKDDNTVGVLRLSDMAAIPLDPANSDYQRYLRWLENPNADEFQPPLEG